jgi:hypothetical protein
MTSQSTSSILTTKDLATAEFTYSNPKKNANGGSVMNMYTKGTKRYTTIATPLITTWGARESTDQQGNPTGKWELSLQFPGTNYPDEECTAFYEGMMAVSERIRDDVAANSEEWLGKRKSREVVDEIVGPFFRFSKDKEKAMLNGPTMNIKLPRWKGDWQTELYDENTKPLFLKSYNKSTDGQVPTSPIEFLPKLCKVMCLIECSGIWFVGNSIYVTWSLKQAMVRNPEQPEVIEGTCFIKPSESDIEGFKQSENVNMIEDGGETKNQESIACVVEDDDSDEDSDEEQEQEPEQESTEVVEEPSPVKTKAPPKKKAPAKKKGGK